MHSDWDILAGAGAPMGAVAPARLPPADELQAALTRVTAAGMNVVEAEVLTAWLQGFSHHWPRAFEALVGPLGRQLLARGLGAVDANRVLKLRRVAVGLLARVL